jgi:hypothetical protein
LIKLGKTMNLDLATAMNSGGNHHSWLLCFLSFVSCRLVPQKGNFIKNGLSVGHPT